MSKKKNQTVSGQTGVQNQKSSRIRIKPQIKFFKLPVKQCSKCGRASSIWAMAGDPNERVQHMLNVICQEFEGVKDLMLDLFEQFPNERVPLQHRMGYSPKGYDTACTIIHRGRCYR